MLSGHDRAILFNGAGKPFESRDFPLPKHIEPIALLVRIIMATVCGSNMHTWKGRRPFPIPTILDHEIVGNIAALDECVDRDTRGKTVSTGDRITRTIMSNCGTCLSCRMKDLPQKFLKLFKYGHAKNGFPTYFTEMHNYDAKHLGTALDFFHATKGKYQFKKLVGPKSPLTVDVSYQAMKSIESAA